MNEEMTIHMRAKKSHVRSLLAICLTAILGCSSNHDSTAASTSPWKQEIKCGDTSYQITSECVASGIEFELNTCKQQTLTQLQLKKTISLPNPNKIDARGIAKAGNKGRLFVTMWACDSKGSDHFLHLYYYAGTGREMYDEYDEIYDKNLSPIHSTNKQLLMELERQSWGAPKVSVDSIMSLEGKKK